MDVLSDLLREVRVEASAMASLQLHPPFHLQFAYDLPYSMTVTRGTCTWLDPSGQAHTLHEGDSLLVLQALQSSFASDPALPPESMGVAWNAHRLPSFHGEHDFAVPLQLRWGGDATAPGCELLGIAFSFDARCQSPLVAMLPAWLVVPAHCAGHDAAVKAALAVLTAEQERGAPGYAALAAHHAETVFLGLLRAHALSADEASKGLLAALRDRRLAAALQALHAEPGERWTVERLAQAAALSRSAFSERFAAVMGTTPMQYVGWVRMRAASRLLDGGTPVASVAEQAGYASERAFRAAFERHFDMSPGVWRRAVQRRR